MNVRIVVFSFFFITSRVWASDIVNFWSGSLLENSAVISLSSSSDADIKIEYSDKKNFRKHRFLSESVRTMKELNYFSKITLSDLEPATKYYYRFSVNGVVNKESNMLGEFSTPSSSPFSYKITLATCANTGSSHPVYDRIREEGSLFYLMLGDFHYGNIYKDCDEEFLSHYNAALGSIKQSKLYKSTPVAYMWDDHDYGPNNSSGLSPNQDGDIACRSVAKESYRNYVPHYPLAFQGEDAVISQTFKVGRVKYILTDLRSEKSRPLFQGDCDSVSPSNCNKVKQGTNFGTKEHLDWFKQELLDAKSKNLAVVWHSSFPYLSTPDLGWFNCDDENTIKTNKGFECDDHDNWGWYPEEREDIANFIKQNDIPICIVSGDAHMSAIDDGTNSDYAKGGGAPIPILHAGPLDRTPSIKGGPYSNGVSGVRGQYGIMEVDDDGGDELCVTWKIKNYKGEFVLNTVGDPLQHSFCFQLDN